MQSLLTLFTLMFALGGCYGGPGFLKQSGSAQPASVSVKTSETGVVSGTVDPDSKLSQVIDAPVEGDETSVSFPPGALDVGTDILIQSGSDIATPALADELDIDGFSSPGGAVVVSSTTPVDATIPFTISLPIPEGASLMLADPYQYLVVVFKITKVGEKQTTAGIIPREELVIGNGKVEFQTMYFGVFQPSFTQKIVETPVEVATVLPIQTKIEEKTLPPIEVLGRQPFVIKAGEIVEVTGLNFRPTMTLALGNTDISRMKLVSDTKATFVAPANLKAGVANLAIVQEGTTKNASLIYSPSNDKPVISLAPEKICSDIEFYDMAGVLRKGTKTCANSIPTCTTSGQVGCVTTAAIPSIAKADVPAADLRSGASIVGVAGTLANCSADGATGCVAVAAFKAADMSVAVAGNIKSGTEIGGVTGSFGGFANCSGDNQTGCIATTSYPTVDYSNISAGNIKSGVTLAGIAGSLVRPANCSSDAQTDCVAVPAYKAVDMTNVTAGKIKAGVTLAGVAGDYPSGTYPLTNASAIVNDLDSTTFNSKMKSVTQFEYFDSAGARYTGNGDADIVAANIANSIDIFGAGGTADLESHSDCSADGSVGCVTVAGYKSADMSSAIAGNIKSGVTIAGVAGSVTSESHSDCSSDGTVGCVTVAGYKSADMSAAVAGNIKSGVTIAGVAGSVTSESHSDCSSDGTVGCVTVAAYKSADMSAALAGNIKSGVTIAGVAGSVSSESHSDCSSDGAVGCVTVAGYKSADMSAAVAGNIKSGVTIAGVAGSVTSESHSDCSSDGAIGCVTVAGYKSADMSAAVAGNIKSGVTIAGVAGSVTSESHSDCSSDGTVGCVTVAAFKSAKMADAIATNIKSGVTIAGVAGSVTEESHSSCSSDGAVGCVTVAAFKSAKMADAIATNIKSGVTIAGVAGSVTEESHSSCSSDGAVGCVTVAAFKSAKMADAIATNIKSGVTIAGVAGSVTEESHSSCSSDGAVGCVTVAAFKSAKMADAIATNIKSGVTIAGVAGSVTEESHSSCSSDGAVGCVTVAAFKSAKMADAIATNIKSGVTIAGVAGSVTEESHSSCSSDGAVGCVTVAAFKSAKMADAIATNIKSGVTIAGVAGSVTEESHSNCSSDGATGCITVAAYKSADMSAAVAGNIKLGVTIAGTAGSAIVITGATGTADLTAATFNNQVKSTTAFEYWDSNGLRHNHGGDADIVMGNIKGSVDIFGTTGTFGSNCTADGQTGCTTTATYKSADTGAYSTWDIRKGKTVGGKVGDLIFPRNMVNNSQFQRTIGTLAGNDMYDTIDDDNFAGAFPTQYPSGWQQASGANWIMDSTNDVGGGGGTDSDDACSGAEHCVFVDRISGMMWAKDNGTAYNFEGAITLCEGLTYGGYGDWRLPTQKELMQAYVDGIWSRKAATGLSLATASYWSSTTLSTNTDGGHQLKLNTGSGSNFDKDQVSYRVICTRPQ